MSKDKKEREQGEQHSKEEGGKSIVSSIRWQNLAMALVNIVMAFLFFLKLDPSRWILLILGIVFLVLAVIKGLQFFMAEEEERYKKDNLGIVFLSLGLAIFFFSMDVQVFSYLVDQARLAPFFAALIFFYEGGMHSQYAIFRYRSQSLDWWLNMVFAVASFAIGILIIQYGKGHAILLGILFLAVAVACIYTALIVGGTIKPAENKDKEKKRARTRKPANRKAGEEAGHAQSGYDQQVPSPSDYGESPSYTYNGQTGETEESWHRDSQLPAWEDRTDRGPSAHPTSMDEGEDR